MHDELYLVMAHFYIVWCIICIMLWSLLLDLLERDGSIDRQLSNS